MKRIMTTVLSVAMLSALGACVGGGGDNGGGDNSVPFTSFQDIVGPVTVRYESASQQFTLTDSEGEGSGMPGFSDPTDFESASAIFTYDDDGGLDDVTLRSAEGNEVTFTGSELGPLPGTDFLEINLNDPETTDDEPDTPYRVIIADPQMFGWSYQSFGVWEELTSASGERERYAVVSQTFGAISPPAGVPMRGQATYDGVAAGRFLADANVGSFAGESRVSEREVISNVEANVDFGARNIQFMTTGTMVVDVGDTRLVAEPSLDMTGTLEYEAGSNQFMGSVTTTGGFTGTANGLFYGPAAQEIGGTFITQGTLPPPESGVPVGIGDSNVRYIGAFGAARQPAQ